MHELVSAPLFGVPPWGSLRNGAKYGSAVCAGVAPTWSRLLRRNAWQCEGGRRKSVEFPDGAEAGSARNAKHGGTPIEG